MLLSNYGAFTSMQVEDGAVTAGKDGGHPSRETTSILESDEVDATMHAVESSDAYAVRDAAIVDPDHDELTSSDRPVLRCGDGGDAHVDGGVHGAQDADPPVTCVSRLTRNRHVGRTTS